MGNSPLQVVMFHAFRGRDEQVESMIRMVGESVLAHHPRAEIVLITNDSGGDADLPEWLSRWCEPVDLDRIMFERIRLYADYVDRAASDCHIVFLDTDMLMVRPIDELLGEDADLTVTVRRQSDMPINGGFYVVNSRRREAIVMFFQRFVETYRGMPSDMLAWNGDQLAIAKLLSTPVHATTRSMVIEEAGLRIRYVPVRRYNHTPRPWMLRLLVFRPQARILHFKGPRKQWMERYFRIYLARPVVLLAGRFRGSDAPPPSRG